MSCNRDLSQVPDDILECVFKEYVGGSGDLDPEPHPGPCQTPWEPSPYPISRREVAISFPSLSRSLAHITGLITWEYIVIKHPVHIQLLRSAPAHLRQVTRRLDVSMDLTGGEPYDAANLSALIEGLPNLRIVILNNKDDDAPFKTGRHIPFPVLRALKSRAGLQSLHVGGWLEYITPQDLSWMCEGLPHLQMLHIYRTGMVEQPEEHPLCRQAEPCPYRALRRLSFGPEFHRTNNLLLWWLGVYDVVPSIEELGISCAVTFVMSKPFFLRYANQIQSLTTPDGGDCCATLTVLVRLEILTLHLEGSWVRPHRDILPHSMPLLCTITLVAGKNNQSQSSVAFRRGISIEALFVKVLTLLLEGDYPCLSTVRILGEPVDDGVLVGQFKALFQARHVLLY
ncbi:hypothetical protein DFP72DRAFT_913109 [Ephemerocybe angulata]|uniref:Uncharacterized protein n=1 Tax=Ephemerocybe angulata TaxID=980116 RepID=A0A8H6HNC1_9AGAR|nr:hypothetical protein DFP72DRAFT_913109 [Tulosesus angulatus]